MIALSGKHIYAVSLLLLAATVGGTSLRAQSCNYYVSTSGTDFTAYSSKTPTRGETIATAANGCASGNTICFAPATDILGIPRAYPYASGAYANSSH